MNEAETRAEHIDPALKAAGWGVVEGSRIRREYAPMAAFTLAARQTLDCAWNSTRREKARATLVQGCRLN